MKNSDQQGTKESVLVLCFYQLPSGETFTFLVKSNRYQNSYWKIPGGGVEKGETPIVAACREIFEELGLRIRIEDLLFIKSSTKKSWRQTSEEHTQHLYAANIENVETFTPVAKDGNQILTCETFSVKAIRDYLEKRVLLHGGEILNAHARKIQEVFDFINALKTA